MIFVTRELYNGIQIDSGWERRAERDWVRRSEIYSRYYEVISTLLPSKVQRLCKHGLHDAFVESVSLKGGTLFLLMDAKNALGGFCGRKVGLTFSGIRKRIAVRGLRGQWWLYEEAHLSSKARFSLHVMFDKSDVEIEADDLLIERM